MWEPSQPVQLGLAFANIGLALSLTIGAHFETEPSGWDLIWLAFVWFASGHVIGSLAL